MGARRHRRQRRPYDRAAIIAELAEVLNDAPAIPISTLKGWRHANALARAERALRWFERRAAKSILSQ